VLQHEFKIKDIVFLDTFKNLKDIQVQQFIQGHRKDHYREILDT